jgi:hypothetical protein
MSRGKTRRGRSPRGDRPPRKRRALAAQSRRVTFTACGPFGLWLTSNWTF